MLGEKQQPKNPRHFVFLHIYIKISSHWLIWVWFVHLSTGVFLGFNDGTDREEVKVKPRKWHFHHIKFHRNSFVHKNIKPWIMSSCNHESTWNQLKIRAPLASWLFFSSVIGRHGKQAIQVVYNNNNSNESVYVLSHEQMKSLVKSSSLHIIIFFKTFFFPCLSLLPFRI